MASDGEVNEILKASVGKIPDKIQVGQKIPAIDYASTITKVKLLDSATEFNYLRSRVDQFVSYFNSLVESVDAASNIEV